MKKKIAMIAPYIGVVNRGAETFVIELAKKMRPLFDVNVFAMGEHAEIKDMTVKVPVVLPVWLKSYQNCVNKLQVLASAGSGVRQKNGLLKIFRPLVRFIAKAVYHVIYRLQWALPSEIEQYYFTRTVYRKYLKHGGYDLLYPNNGYWGAYFSNRVRKNTGIPFIGTGHGGIGTGEKRVLKLRPDVYVTISEEALKWAKKYYERVICIHNGVDIKRFTPGRPSLSKKKLPAEKPSVLCVAALTDFKRQNLLIDAMAKLGRGSLVLIGDGELKEKIENLGREKLGKRFLLARVTYNEMPEIYKYCDLFSLPSKKEPLGIVYLEALASNKPCVGPDDAVRREVIGNAGIYCNVEDPGEYAKAIDACYKKKWGGLPRKRAIRLFSWDSISAKYIKLMRSLLK